MAQDDLRAQFDAWAPDYDADVGAEGTDFPFAGYAANLRGIYARAAARPGTAVLDLGVGTGNLARPFLAGGCRVLGVDFSPAMLELARAKLPGLATARADLTAEAWPPEMDGPFGCIVSNYVLHEFPLPLKLDILERLAGARLAAHGRILIGDIIFPDAAARDRARAAHAATWEEEHFWLVDEAQAALGARGWGVSYRPSSFCAGVLLLRPPGR